MEKRILCFGDSNTWGYNAVDSSRFPKKVRWTRLLQKSLGEGYEIIEEGLSGRSAVSEDPLNEGLNGFMYISPCIKSHAPLDLVMIMLGTNDTKERFSLTPNNIAAGIIRTASKIKGSLTGRDGKDPLILVVAPPSIGSGYKNADAFLSMGRECDTKSKEMIPFLKEMALLNGFEFLNTDELVTMNHLDYMHLDVNGHKKMAKAIEDKILKILE